MAWTPLGERSTSKVARAWGSGARVNTLGEGAPSGTDTGSGTVV
jgi:hypothetical protein